MHPNLTLLNHLISLKFQTYSTKFYINSTGRKLSPTPPAKKLTIESYNDKDDKSDEEDPAELRLLLELNEQV